MAQDALKYLAELNKERDDYIYRFLNREDKRHKVFDKEKEFLNLLNDYANTPIIESSLVSIIKNTEIDKDIRKMACLVGFTIDDEALWRKIIKRVLSDQSYLNLSNDVLSILPSKKQKRVLGLYLNDNPCNDSYAHTGNVIYNNGHFDLAEKFIQNNKLIETPNVPHIPQQVQAMLALNGHPTAKALLEEKFINEKNKFDKQDLSYELVLAKSELAFNYMREHAFEDKDIFGYLARFGGQSDFQAIIDAVTHKKNWVFPEDELEELFWYSNPQMMQWFYESLSHPELSISVMFHRLMLDFFDEESPLRKEGEGLMFSDEDEDNIIPLTSKALKSFWKAHKSEINKILNPNNRYYGSSTFDMNTIWENEKYSDRRGIVRDRRTLIMIWTGQYFAFDEHALITKQLEQHKVIADWLADNHDRIKPGKWMRWGEYLS